MSCARGRLINKGLKLNAQAGVSRIAALNLGEISRTKEDFMFCCTQHTGMHIVVVEVLLIAIYLGNELILIGIRKPFRSSTCLRYSWSLSS